MNYKIRQVELLNFLNNFNVIKSCNDLEYKEIIEILVSEIPNEPRKIEYLIKLISEFRNFSTVLIKHLMIERDHIKRKMIENEKEQPKIVEEAYDISKASKYLGISRPTIYGLMENNLIKTFRTGRNKQKISKRELDRYLKENKLFE
jgi:excisionase family DNA binding protein